MPRWNDAVLTRDELHRRKRQAVIREAGRAFSKQGFHGTSLGDIAKTLNVTKAALYHYVKSKHEILFECHKLEVDMANEALDLAKREGSTGLDTLTRFLDRYIESLTDEFGTCVVLTDINSLEAKDRKKIVTLRDAFAASLCEIVEAGIEDGSIVECNPRLANVFIMGAVNWISTWYSPDGELTGQVIAKAFVQFVVAGLARRETATT